MGEIPDGSHLALTGGLTLSDNSAWCLAASPMHFNTYDLIWSCFLLLVRVPTFWGLLALSFQTGWSDEPSELSTTLITTNFSFYALCWPIPLCSLALGHFGLLLAAFSCSVPLHVY